MYDDNNNRQKHNINFILFTFYKSLDNCQVHSKQRSLTREQFCPPNCMVIVFTMRNTRRISLNKNYIIVTNPKFVVVIMFLRQPNTFLKGRL